MTVHTRTHTGTTHTRAHTCTAGARCREPNEVRGLTDGAGLARLHHVVEPPVEVDKARQEEAWRNTARGWRPEPFPSTHARVRSHKHSTNLARRVAHAVWARWRRTRQRGSR